MIGRPVWRYGEHTWKDTDGAGGLTGEAHVALPSDDEARAAARAQVPKPWERDLSDEDHEAYYAGVDAAFALLYGLEEPPCSACDGHGNIWVSWHPTPVQCGACHGTGKAP